MTSKIGLMEISELREVLAYASGVSGDGPALNDAVQVAHDTVQTICQEAARYGLTRADVVRAILNRCSRGSAVVTVRHAKLAAVKRTARSQSK